MHSTMRRLTGAACLALLPSPAQSQPRRDAMWDDFEHLFDDANLTTVQPMKGYDVRKEFPGSPSSSWEVFIDLRNEVPYEALLPHVAKGETRKGPRMLERVGFRPTGDLVDKDGLSRTVDDWGFCYLAHPLWDLDLADDAEIKSNCEGAFSKECTKWLADFNKDGKLCQQRDTQDTYYPWEDSPCSNYSRPNVYGEDMDMAPFAYGNMSDVTSSGRGYIIQNIFQDEDNYDRAAKAVWYISVGWMPGPVGEAHSRPLESGTIGAEGDFPASAGLCLRHGMKTTTLDDSDGGDDNETSEKDGNKGSNDEEGSSEGDGEDDAPDGAMEMHGSMAGVLGAVAVVLAVNDYWL